MREEEIAFGAPRRRQHKALGILLRLSGVALYILSVISAIGAVNPANKYNTLLFSYQTPGRNLLVFVGLLLLSSACYTLGRILRRHGRRHSATIIRTMDFAKEKSYVLYLRPFSSDKISALIPEPKHTSLFYGFHTPEAATIEENLSRMFYVFGRLIAAGQPDERLPQPGAARLYLPMHGWQRAVTSLVEDAQLILLVTGTSAGTLWELREVVRLRKPHHLLLIVFSNEVEYGEFRTQADQILAEHAGASTAATRPPTFPDYPPLFAPGRVDWLPVIRGLIWFKRDWSPQFVRLDPTAVEARRKKRVRRMMAENQVRPLLEYLLAAHAAEANETNRLDMGHRMTLAQIEAFVLGFLEEEHGRGVPVRAKLTPGLGVRSLGRTTPAPKTPTSSDPAFTLDMPAGVLLETTRKARERGAGDSDTLRLTKNNWGAWRLLVEPTGVQLRADDITIGHEDFLNRPLGR